MNVVYVSPSMFRSSTITGIFDSNVRFTTAVKGFASLGEMINRSIFCLRNVSTSATCFALSCCVRVDELQLGMSLGGFGDVGVHRHAPRFTEVGLRETDPLLTALLFPATSHKREREQQGATASNHASQRGVA